MIFRIAGESWVRLQELHCDVIRWRNRGRPRLFYFADSRSVDVRRRYTKRDPLSFYPASLVREFETVVRIVPYRHTTVVDFLWEYQRLAEWADIVVAHVGIVDFSPRPKRDAYENVYGLKRERYDAVFGCEAMRRHLEGRMDCDYEGQPTQNLFSLEMAGECLLPRLRSIPNLIFVGCNALVPGWEGNYTRGRPANMTIVMDYSRLLCGGLARPVTFDDWGEAEIRRYTVDNIHYTPEGGEEVGRRIRTAVDHCLVR